MHLPYVHMHAYVGGLHAGRFISIMPFVLSVSHQDVGAGINTQPAYLSSAAHLEPVFMYKGEVCTGKFVFIPAKGNMKVYMQLITAGRINRV